MSLRLIEIIIPAERLDELHELLGDEETVGVWTDPLDDERARGRALVPTQRTETLTDRLSERFAGEDAFRLMLFTVEATLPQVEEPAEDEEREVDRREDPEAEEEREPTRVSREELYQDILEGTEISPVYAVTVALSTVVAAIGLLRGQVAVVIGAMVIAPLLGPNVALALATTLGDLDLARRAFKAIALGLGVASALSVLLGYLVGVDPTVPEIASRTRAGIADVGLALAAGSAAALAFTTGLSEALIGVMVAVALLPPLVTAGLLVGAGQWSLAGGALVLVLTNVACINLTAVVTFLAQRIRPRLRWEEAQARRATRTAVASWLGLLALLVGVIWLIWR